VSDDVVLFMFYDGVPFIWYEKDASYPPNEQWGETERKYPECDGCKQQDIPLVIIVTNRHDLDRLYFCEDCMESMTESFQ
jgi:hypothetical protein